MASGAAGVASGVAAAGPILLTPRNGSIRKKLPDGGEAIWAPGDLDAIVQRRGADGTMMTERAPLVRVVPGADGHPRTVATDIGAIFLPGHRGGGFNPETGEYATERVVFHPQTGRLKSRRSDTSDEVEGVRFDGNIVDTKKRRNTHAARAGSSGCANLA